MKDSRLTKGQMEILTELYRFRFGTRELIAKSLRTKNSTPLYKRLKLLKEKKYIEVRLKPSYKLQGKPASYSVSPLGLRLLREQNKKLDISDQTIKYSYKNKIVTEDFITHNLNLFKIYCSLKSIYPKINFFTKPELEKYDYFPKPLPDAYLMLKGSTKTHRYFLLLVDENFLAFVLDRLIRRYTDYYERSEWPGSSNEFPAILIVCESSKMEQRTINRLARRLRQTDEELNVKLTTLPAINKLTASNLSIWSDISEPETLYKLA